MERKEKKVIGFSADKDLQSRVHHHATKHGLSEGRFIRALAIWYMDACDEEELAKKEAERAAS